MKKVTLSVLAGLIAMSYQANADVVAADTIMPVVQLSEKMGAVALEARANGINLVESAKTLSANTARILYIDVDSLGSADAKTNEKAIFAKAAKGLAQGYSVVFETSQFDFDNMHEKVFNHFPDAQYNDIKDVTLLLKMQGDQLVAQRLDPQEFAALAGVQPQMEDIAAQLLIKANTPKQDKEVASTQDRSLATQPASASLYGSIPSNVQYTLRFAEKAYESNPSDNVFNLKYNSTYVDVWKKRYYPLDRCVVAWRGTDTTNMWDVYADLSSQLSYSAKQIDKTISGMKGGKGFVNRLHSYDDAVNNVLQSNGCNHITVTGHSLGGAVAQLHMLQLGFSSMSGNLEALVAYNSPNVVDSHTQSYFASNIAGLIDDGHHELCKHHDWLVNPLPTGLVRLGPQNSSPNKGCSYVASGSWSPSPTTNHNLSLWSNEFNNQ